MDKKHLTPLEAWDDFYSWFQADGKTPNEIVLAEYTRRAKLKVRGKTKALGEKRIRRLLEKYAPGRYTFHQSQPFFTFTDQITYL